MSPSIAQQVAERSESLVRNEAKSDFFKLMRLLLKHGSATDAREHAKVERARERVQNILAKAAVVGGGLDSWSSIADYVNVQAAFQESLRTASVFDAMLDGGMVRAPLRSRGFSVVTGISGGVVSERSFKPISSLVLQQQLHEPKKVSAIVIASKELENFSGASTLFADELTKAIIAATDSFFLSSLISATTPTSSAGATLANVVADFDTLLTAVVTSATSKLFYIASPANVKSLMTKGAVGGQPAFPSLGINGGEIFPGVTAIASDFDRKLGRIAG